METINNMLQKIRPSLKLKDLKNFSDKDPKELVEELENEEVDKEDLKSIIKLFPSAVEATIEYLRTVAVVCKKAGNEGDKTLEAIQKCIDSLHELCKREDLSDENVEKIADLLIEVVRDLKEINKDNKRFWLKVTGIVTIVIALIIYIIARETGENAA